MELDTKNSFYDQLRERTKEEKEIGELATIKKWKPIIKSKYKGKTIRDLKYKETFVFDGPTDWWAVWAYPKRFKVVEK